MGDCSARCTGRGSVPQDAQFPRGSFPRGPVPERISRNSRRRGISMDTDQGSLQLLDDPVALELLESRELARLAYSWLDGTPRVVPIWFHWTGDALTFGTPPRAPKLRALERQPRVAVTIDAGA